MLSLRQFRFPPPICTRCHIDAVRLSIETVEGPKAALLDVQVYGCATCGKMTAREIGPAANEEPIVAA
jgi:hypothetical protein